MIIQSTKLTGFTLIELMIVVAIIGILSAIAIPAYNGYIRTSKATTHFENFSRAYHFTKSEASKVSIAKRPDLICVDVLNTLNSGGTHAPGDPTIPAFTSAAPAPGQIQISGLAAVAAKQCVVTGNLITITSGAFAQGTLATDYAGGAIPAAASFTAE